jgi:vancomycin resistance protein VanW
MKTLKQLIPQSVKLEIRLLRTKIIDFFSKEKIVFQTQKTDNQCFTFKISLKQPIMNGPYFENKIHNIRQGCEAIENVLIPSQGVFSFWKCVKRPSEKNNFRIGRNLLNGKLSIDFGGGLCQLSSIIYHNALMAGLEIVERHHHSFDIYEEHERFTPLGADATVVYGYKDLKLRNPYGFPIAFGFEITNDFLLCKIFSEKEIFIQNIDFQRVVNEKTIQVFAKTSEKCIAESVYLQK